jgi:hypothetical protein
MVELQEFVTTALREILEGVRDAQTEIRGNGEVNPPIWSGLRADAAKHGILESSNGKWIHLVEFDVAVSAGEAAGNKGKIGVLAGAVGLGSQRESSTESTTVSRIKFSVPVAFPATSTQQP